MPGLLRGIARTAVIAGTATHVSNNVSRRQARKWGAQDQAAAQDQDQAADAAAPDAQPAASDTSTQLDDLEKLGELHKQGILTDAEFDAKKQQILAQ